MRGVPISGFRALKPLWPAEAPHPTLPRLHHIHPPIFPNHSPLVTMSDGTTSSAHFGFTPSPVQEDSAGSSGSPGAEDVQFRPVAVMDHEDDFLCHILDLIKWITPHMRESFIMDKEWWENNRDNRCLHVRLISLNRRCTAPNNPLVLDVQVCPLSSGRDHCERVL